MYRRLTIFLGLGLWIFSQQTLAVNILEGSFAAYANSVVGKSGSFFTDLGNELNGPNWSSANFDVDGAITDTSAETSILAISTGAYVDLAFSAPVFDGAGNDLKLFFVGNNGHFFDLSVFVGGVSKGTVTYSLPNPSGDTGFTDSDYPTDGIFAIDVDFADFGGLGTDSVSKIRLMIGDAYTANSAVLSFVGAYNTTPPTTQAIKAGDLAPLNQPDGALNAGDVVVMERLVLGQLQPTQEQRLAADVAPLSHPDGQINAGDLVVLMRAVTGQVTLPPINAVSGGFELPYLVPPNNQTQQSSITVYGTASPLQSVNLYVNGALAATLTADSLGNFQSTVSLQAGPNSLYAVGLAGAFESESSNLVSVFYGTALPPVDWQQVVVTDPGGGQIQLTAQPGTVAAGMNVTLTSKSGGTQTVTANADGSFSATLAGSGTNEPVTITVDDGAGNHSPASGNQAVGALSATFLVSETGAATYTIPIEVPPGIAGMQPELSLNYSSQSGNGPLGVGWGLSGLSAITRCPKTYAQDAVYDGVSYDSNDRYCLDGQRLVNVSGNYGADGTVYRTEVDSFSLITQNGTGCGGPCGFTVQTRSGQTMVYGNSDNSRRNVSTTAAALSWAVNSVTDVAGNSIQFAYYKNTFGDHRIQHIDYVNASQVRQVVFLYETRSDVARGYVAGSYVVSDQRLKTVRTRVGTDIVKEYRLAYETGAITHASRIIAVTECGFESTGVQVCIPPTNFQWQQGSVGYAPTLSTPNSVSLNPGFYWQADFDGDGRQEIASAAGGQITIWRYSKDASGAGSLNQISRVVNSQWGPAAYTQIGDFNGDGKADIASEVGASVFMKFGANGDFGSATWAVDGLWGGGDFTWVGDFNGDGLSDIASASGGNVYMKLSTGSGFTSSNWPVQNAWGNAAYTWVADFNGDGLSDIASASGSKVYLKLSTGSGFVSKIWGVTSNWSDSSHTWVGDINGDGKADIATSSGTTINVKLSTGKGFAEGAWTVPGLSTAYSVSAMFDYNGDGLLDAALDNYNTVDLSVISVSSGNQFSAPVPISPLSFTRRFTYGSDKMFFGDIDGDGHSDFSDWNGVLQVRLSSVKTEAIVAVTPGIGSQVTVAYKPLSDGYFYGSCPGYPVRCSPVPMTVVSDHYVDDGIGGISQFSYRFLGARVHLRGRGFLGFQSRSINDLQNGVDTITDYAVNTSETVIDTFPDRYPYAGMALSMSSYQLAVRDPAPPAPPGRVRIASTTVIAFQSYDSMRVTEFNLKQTVPGVYFPYARVKQDVQREVTGGVLSTTTTTTDYDTSGNVTLITAQTVGNTEIFTKTTDNQYDPTNLRLGRLTRATVTTTTPDGVATRTSGFTYYPDGLLRQEIIEPDEPDTSPLKQVTEYAYDSFGNKTSVSVTALASDSPTSGLQTRTTQTRYDNTGLFPVRSINALGHDEHYQYDPRFGVKTQLIGPNRLPTSWQYDALGRLVREIRADGSVTITDYTWCPSSVCPYGGTRAISETTGSVHTAVYRDAQDREIRAETEGLQPGSQINQDTEYDQFGRVYRKSRPYYTGDTPQWATFAYDQLDRLIEEYRPDGSQMVYAYAPFTKTTTNYIVGGDVAQIAKTETFDAMGRLRQVVEELGVTTTFQYDPYDNLAQVTDNAGNVTTTQYDRRGRKTRMNDPDMGQWDYRYNGFGELTFQQDNKLQQVAMTYDALGRMTRRDEPEGTTTWTYDTAPHGTGKLARVNAPNGFTRTPGYDALGRVLTDVRVITGQTFQTAYTYDRFGRVTDTVYPSGFTTRNVYDTRGFLTEVRNAANDALYWQANAADADGQITRETYGNNLTTLRSYNPASGRIDLITTGMGTGSGIQFLDYTFDTLGNLQQRSRSEGTTSLSESFNYDALNRLKLVSISGVGNKTYNYDSLGNITQKGTVSDYRYAERAAGPHAVSYANGQNYDYDANGNMLSGAGRTLTWSSYNKPVQIQKGQTTVQFDYGPGRARYRQVKTTGSETTTTVYIGKLYEQISKVGTTERKHYIIAGGRAIALYSDKGAGQTSTQYLHHDHLGSVDVITDESGAAVERLSFAAFGSRRNIDWTDATGLITSQFTTRGFTGHEQLDEVGLVHMNGRVYDPVLGRFLSADPQVQFPSASQSFNRYSYVNNNPLSYTDPSGFGLFSGFKKLFKGIGSAIKKAFKSPVFRAIVGIAAAYLTYGALNGAFIWGGDFTAAFASGFVGGAITTGSLKGALVGGATALAFYGVGSAFPSASKLRGAAPWKKGRLWFGKIVAHGTVGGASSAAQGGSFQDGFRSAGFTQLAAPVIGSVPGDAVGRTAAAAVVGGTASRLGGGKFANGATTFGFLRLFGEVANYAGRQTDRLKQLACNSGGNDCVADERGVLRTDGGRDIDYTLNPEKSGNWLTRSGMGGEGLGSHIYENNTLVRNFIIDVSKIHDWFNSWNYSPSNGFYMSRGAGFDSAFQIYSFTGMPVAGLATVAGYASNAPFGQQMLYYNIYRNSR